MGIMRLFMRGIMNQRLANHIRKTIIDMKKKNLLPQHTIGYFDEHMIPALVGQLELQKFKEWSCTFCGITVYGPKMLLLQHHKIHSQKRDLGDNENYKLDYKLY